MLEALAVVILMSLVCVGIDVYLRGSKYDDKNHPTEDEIER